jgi:hypothetical protein
MLDLKDPQIRQDIKSILIEALEEREAERTKRIVAEFEKSLSFGLQEEKSPTTMSRKSVVPKSVRKWKK